MGDTDSTLNQVRFASTPENVYAGFIQSITDDHRRLQ